MFHGTYILFNSSIHYMFVHNQLTLIASIMIKDEVQYEIDAFNMGVLVHTYYTDNGVFTT